MTGKVGDEGTFDPDFPELAMKPLAEEEKAQLVATGEVVAALIRAGGKVDDLSQIFCLNCKLGILGKPVNLKGVAFDHAMLRGATFVSADLQGASFKDADLVGADFTSASLVDAKLTAEPIMVPFALQAGYATKQLMNVRGTNFACADLTRADLSGRVVFGLIYEDPIFGGSGRDEFFGANLREANFVGAQFFVALPQRLASENSKTISALVPVTDVATGPSDAIDYVGGKYAVWTVALREDTRFSTPIKGPYRRSLLLILSSLKFAKNVSEAKMPSGVLEYLRSADVVLEKPIKSYDCKGGANIDITHMFSPDDTGPKNMRP